VKLLLDTHIALWAVADDPSLSEIARELILAPSNQVWVSAVSIWEIAIKYKLKRKNPATDMPISGRQAIDFFRASNFRFLNIEPEHAVAVEALPDYHQDPFDRLLVAQAALEPMRLITHDQRLSKYSDAILLV
jgi:PIN domain nuclease of toxin-antitoxin system